MSKSNPQRGRRSEYSKIRRKALSQTEEGNGESLVLPKSEFSYFYQELYLPQPKWIRFGIKLAIVIMIVLIAVDYGTRHARSITCQ